MFAKPEPEATAIPACNSHQLHILSTYCNTSLQHLIATSLQVTPGWWAAPLTRGGRCCGGEGPRLMSTCLGGHCSGGCGGEGPGVLHGGTRMLRLGCCLGVLMGCCDFVLRFSAASWDSALCPPTEAACHNRTASCMYVQHPATACMSRPSPVLPPPNPPRLSDISTHARLRFALPPPPQLLHQLAFLPSPPLPPPPPSFFTDARLRELTPLLDPSHPSGLDYYPLTRPGERFPVNDPGLQPRLTPRPDDDAAFLQGAGVVGGGWEPEVWSVGA